MNQPKPTTKLLLTAQFCLLCFSLVSTPAYTQEKVHTLRIQTHFNPEQELGKLASEFVNDVQLMSNGQLKIELHYSSSVVSPAETFSATAAGVLDGDMSSGSFQVSQDPSFQFVSNIIGAYDTPYQQYAWLYQDGGELVQNLYNRHGMQFVGWWIAGQESLSSSTPLESPADLANYRLRSSPGLESQVFASLGAKPAAMDFSDIHNALKSDKIDGADASGLANNKALGLYDLARHATYPGFHSMPADHLAINKSKWDTLPAHLQHIIQVAMQKLAFQTALTFEVKNQDAAGELIASGVTLHDWSQSNRRAFRAAAYSSWEKFAEGSTDAEALVQSHKAFGRRMGLAP